MTTTQPVHDILHTIVQWATRRSSIRLVLLTSTRAIPNAPIDVLSDFDVILIVQDIHPFVADHAWLNDFGEVLLPTGIRSIPTRSSASTSAPT